MATDVNKESRKRKSASDLMLEVDEADLSPSNTPEPTDKDGSCPISETEATQTSTDVSKVSSDIMLNSDDITLKQVINNTSDESIVKLECTVVSNELNMETNSNNSLKLEESTTACSETSAEIVAKAETVVAPEISKTDIDLRCMDMEVDNSSPPPPSSIDKPFISVIFRDKDTAYHIRSKIMHCIQSVIDFELKLKLTTTFPSDLTLDFWEEKVETAVNYDIPENIQATSYKPEPDNLELFVVDTTPSKNSESRPRYFRANLCKPIGEPEPATNGQAENACRSFQICFNCDGDHSMKDCKEIRNARRIAMARNKFKSQQPKNVRYHVDDEVKYKHLVPGKISDELRRALDIRKHELPHYIYRMRTLGYPPGWLQEAMISNSQLELFDFQGCVVDGSGDGDSKKIDATKVVEYPGFNAPLEKGFKDEFKYYNCPPFNEKHSKNCMVEYIEQLGGMITAKKQTVTLDSTPKQVESDSNSQGSVCAQKVRRSESPTLTDLELRKKQLLAELEDGSLNSPQPTIDTADKQINPLSKDLIESPVVKSSSFGTPLLKSASPYIQLPERDKFSKDISQVINFENLPDATGKYEQMSVVINKVRETVKSSKS